MSKLNIPRVNATGNNYTSDPVFLTDTVLFPQEIHVASFETGRGAYARISARSRGSELEPTT